MPEYICPKCKKVMTRLDAYTIHINRKHSCIIEERLANKDKMKDLEDKVDSLSIIVKEQQIQIDKLMLTIDQTNNKLLSQLLQSISIKDQKMI